MASKVVLIFVRQYTEIDSFKKLEDDAILKPKRNIHSSRATSRDYSLR